MTACPRIQCSGGVRSYPDYTLLRGRAADRPHAPDPRAPRSSWLPDRRGRQVRRLCAQQEPAARGTQTHVPARRARRVPASRDRGRRRVVEAPLPDALAAFPRVALGDRATAAGALTGMGKRFDLLVFDWDGTVVDSAGHIVDSIQAAARDIGLAVPSGRAGPPHHRPGLGRRHDVSVSRSLPRADYPRLAERYRFHYLAGDHKRHAVRRRRRRHSSICMRAASASRSRPARAAWARSRASGFRAAVVLSRCRAARMRAFPSRIPTC